MKMTNLKSMTNLGQCEPMGSICDHLPDQCNPNFEFIGCNIQDYIGMVLLRN